MSSFSRWELGQRPGRPLLRCPPWAPVALQLPGPGPLEALSGVLLLRHESERLSGLGRTSPGDGGQLSFMTHSPSGW